MTRVGRIQAAALAATMACVLGGLPGRARAEGDWNAGSVVATALYAPAKVLYAATGVLVGGIGWGLSGGDRAAMEAVMEPAVHGDYVITPEHLRGERRLEFVGSASPASEPDPSMAGAEEVEDPYEELYFDY